MLQQAQAQAQMLQAGPHGVQSPPNSANVGQHQFMFMPNQPGGQSSRADINPSPNSSQPGPAQTPPNPLANLEMERNWQMQSQQQQNQQNLFLGKNVNILYTD